MTMPNFFIIGAMKAGTTALYHYLNKHPQIYMSPKKEPSFFSFEGRAINYCGPGDIKIKPVKLENGTLKWPENYGWKVFTLEDYQNLFNAVSNEIAIGEASTSYLYSKKAPMEIKKNIPNAKLIAILRNPVDRAYSNYLQLLRLGREPIRDFFKAFNEEEKRISNRFGPDWHYKQKGLYYNQLKQYYDNYEESQIRVYLYDDFKSDPVRLLKDIFSFLCVDQNFIPDISGKYNTSFIPKYKTVNIIINNLNNNKIFRKYRYVNSLNRRLIKTLKKFNNFKPSLSSEVRKQLVKIYREDILKLQDLIRRDLSMWLEY